ncbi:MAG: tetratricopeptide repeat protein, partial [Holosporales bacterium]
KIFLWRAIGALDGEQGKFAEACRSYQTAYELAESSGNKKEMGKTLWHWGALMLKNKGTQGGFRKLNRAFDIAQELDDTLSQAHILSDLAEGHHSAGNIQEASKLAKGALAIYQHLEHAKGIERTTAFLKRLEPAALPPS